ncbi:MAG TPA: LemA family protein [Salinivirgaceae bacterium]|nr:LemA family protein [Salinivirgaceae bacterium]
MNDKNIKPKGTGCLASTLLGVPIVLILTILSIISFSAYNGMVSHEETVKSQWGNVENNYQRRIDLVENLVSVVKGYADHENQTLLGVIEARSKATGITLSVKDLTPENVEQFQNIQDNLSGALSRLLVVAEQYPDLKAQDSYRQLMKSLEQIEAEILIQRSLYNDKAREYNTYIRRFPKVLFAKMFGFEPIGYFKASPEAVSAPKVTM